MAPLGGVVSGVTFSLGSDGAGSLCEAAGAEAGAGAAAAVDAAVGGGAVGVRSEDCTSSLSTEGR